MRLSLQTFRRIIDQVHRLCGLVIPQEKEYLIHDRLRPIIAAQGLSGFDDLANKLQDDRHQQLVDLVLDAITTQETSFFRDAHIFAALEKEIYPALAREAAKRQSSARIWSAGTSTGQEAYSLAMMADEWNGGYRGYAFPAASFSLLGTDVSQAAIAEARQGSYRGAEAMRGLSPTRIAKYMVKEGHHYRVTDRIRRNLEFRRMNLIHDQHDLGTFDMIVCRNVLIYFDFATRQQICNRFARLLRPHGWLLLGAAENLYGIIGPWESKPLGEKGLIYQRL